MEEVMQPLNINEFGNFMIIKTSSMNFQSKESNAFWRSILIAHLGDRVTLMYPLTSSDATRTLSIVLLPAMNAY